MINRICDLDPVFKVAGGHSFWGNALVEGQLLLSKNISVI